MSTSTIPTTKAKYSQDNQVHPDTPVAFCKSLDKIRKDKSANIIYAAIPLSFLKPAEVPKKYAQVNYVAVPMALFKDAKASASKTCTDHSHNEKSCTSTSVAIVDVAGTSTALPMTVTYAPRNQSLSSIETKISSVYDVGNEKNIDNSNTSMGNIGDDKLNGAGSEGKAAIENEKAEAVDKKPIAIKECLTDESIDTKSKNPNKVHVDSEDPGIGYSFVPNKDQTFINTIEQLREFLPQLKWLKKNYPELFADCEGWNLCRFGTLSLLQLTIASLKHTWVLDVTVLHEKVFDTEVDGISVRKTLENKKIWKIFWDVRNDSDALFKHYDIRLGGVRDLQLMEVMTREYDRTYLLGLASCVQAEGVKSGEMTKEEVAAWMKIKNKGTAYFRSNPLGYGVFDQIPRPAIAMKYAGQDTSTGPMLWRVYSARMPTDPKYKALLRNEEGLRTVRSWTKEYEPNSYNKRFAPKSFRALPAKL